MTDPNIFLSYLSAIDCKITLIGMSGLGKSHWSRMLEKRGYKRFCCDDLIADRLLDASCDKALGKVDCLGRWMGFPHAAGYKEKEKAYLIAESELLRELIAYLETSRPEEKIVIDTTGSAPYAGDMLLQRLGELTRIVHLAASPAYFKEMARRYVASPRPVVWGELYRKLSFETESQALSRCYEALLTYRESLYRKYAYRSVDYELHRI